jgi:hypothetical protein
MGISERAVQLVFAAAAVVLAILLATQSAWPFDASRPKLPTRPSLWQLLLSDHVTLGFVRLAFVMLAGFVIASVPALVSGGRWLKSFGAGGLIADDATDCGVRSKHRSARSSERPATSRQRGKSATRRSHLPRGAPEYF